MKQYLLVPEDLYNRLEAHLDDPVDNRKDRGLTAVLHDKNLDTTARKEIYSQNLNAHIENLREARTRPLKVQTYVPPKKPSPNIHLFQNPYYDFAETPTPPTTPVNIQPF